MSDFRFHIPLTSWIKSGDENTMRVGGLVSTDDLDRQGEVVVADGLDFTPFLSHGWFNDNHGQRTADVLGYPTEAFRVKKGQKLPNGADSSANGWWAEGYLLDTPEGRKVYELCSALVKAPRRIGFSIEGKVVERDEKDKTRIVAAEVRNVAITHCPVNTSTEMQALAKALTAGSSVTDPGAAAGEGFPLRAESMDGAKKKKKKKKKGGDDESTLFDLAGDPSEDGGQANLGGVAGKNPHLTKGDNSEIDRKEQVPSTTIEYVAQWADTMSKIHEEPVAVGMTKSEARIIVASMRPHLSISQIDQIVDSTEELTNATA